MSVRVHDFRTGAIGDHKEVWGWGWFGVFDIDDLIIVAYYCSLNR